MCIRDRLHRRNSPRRPVDSLFRRLAVEVFVVGLRVGAGMVEDAVPMIRRRIERIELQWTTAGIDDVVIRPGRDESQHHQYRQWSTEALYALCAAESSGRRPPPYPRRRGGRQRTLRRQDDGIASQLGVGASYADGACLLYTSDAADDLT